MICSTDTHFDELKYCKMLVEGFRQGTNVVLASDGAIVI
jgi:hypothetical protein